VENQVIYNPGGGHMVQGWWYGSRTGASVRKRTFGQNFHKVMSAVPMRLLAALYSPRRAGPFAEHAGGITRKRNSLIQFCRSDQSGCLL